MGSCTTRGPHVSVQCSNVHGRVCAGVPPGFSVAVCSAVLPVVRDGQVPRTVPAFVTNLFGNHDLATAFRFTITRASRRALEVYVTSEAVGASLCTCRMHGGGQGAHTPSSRTAAPLRPPANSPPTDVLPNVPPPVCVWICTICTICTICGRGGSRSGSSGWTLLTALGPLPLLQCSLCPLAPLWLDRPLAPLLPRFHLMRPEVPQDQVAGSLPLHPAVGTVVVIQHQHHQHPHPYQHPHPHHHHPHQPRGTVHPLETHRSTSIPLVGPTPPHPCPCRPLQCMLVPAAWP